LNANGDNDVRHTEKYTTEPLVSQPNTFEFELAFEKPKVTNHQVLTKPRQN